MNESQRNNLRKLDIMDGDGILSCMRKLSANDPVVIIGLGGLGCETVNDLKREISRRVERENNIHILAFDSANGDFNGLEALEDREKRFLYEPGISGMTSNENNVPLMIKKWKNPHHLPDLNGEGCGAIRQNGRFILSYAPTYNKVRGAIKQAIQDAKDGTSISRKLNVIVIAGISGGTGSGMFIDTSYLVYDIIEELGLPNDTYSVSAYLFLPDVQYNVSHINKDALKKNGGAALKELDHFMNLKKVNGVYKWPFEGGETHDKLNNIYNFCTLISGNTEVGMVGDDAKARAKRVLIENVISLVTAGSEAGIKDSNGNAVPLLTSFLDNMQNNLSMWFQGRGSDRTNYPRSTNYCYNIVGFGTAKIPVDAIMSYMAHNMFEQVLQEYREIGRVDNNLVNRFFGTIGVTPDTVVQKMKAASGLTKPTAARPNGGSIKRQDAKFQNYINQLINNAMARLNAADFKQAINNLYKELINLSINTLDGYFKNNKPGEPGGPYFVSKLITASANRDDCDGIYNRLIELVNMFGERAAQLNNKFPSAEAILGLAAGKAQTIETNMLGMVSQESADRVCREIEKLVEQAVYDRVIMGPCSDLIIRLAEGIQEQNNTIFDIYTSVFDYVRDMLQKNAELVVKTGKDVEKNTTTYSVDVVNLDEANSNARMLKSCLDDYIGKRFIDKFRAKFSDVIRNPELKNKMTAAGESFDAYGVIVSSFDSILDGFYSQAIERFIVAYYAGNGGLSADDIDSVFEDGVRKAGILNTAAKNIVDLLASSSIPLCQLAGGVVLDGFAAKKTYITCPEDADDLFIAISNAVKAAPAGKLANVTVCKKAKANSIDCVINYSCVPLGMIAGMDEVDRVYSTSIMGSDRGTHLDESVNSDWTLLPSIFPREMWKKLGAGNYKSVLELRNLDLVKKCVDKAFKYGVIYTKNGEYHVRSLDIDKTSGDEYADDKKQSAQEKIDAAIPALLETVTKDTKPEEILYLVDPSVVFEDKVIAIDSSWGINSFANDKDRQNINLYYRMCFDELINLMSIIGTTEEFNEKTSAKDKGMLGELLDKAMKAIDKKKNEQLENERLMREFADFNGAVAQFIKCVKTRLIFNNSETERWMYVDGEKENMLYYYGLANSFEKEYVNFFTFKAFMDIPAELRAMLVNEANDIAISGNIKKDQLYASSNLTLMQDTMRKLAPNGNDHSLNRELNRAKINREAAPYAEKYFAPLSDDIKEPFDILGHFYKTLRDELG